MKARTHDLAALSGLGLIIVTRTVPVMTLGTLLLALLANQIGGIAPDIDQPIAPFWRNLPIGGLLGKIISKMLGGHRFITHSLLGMALLGFLAYWLLRFLQPIMPHVIGGVVWWAFMIGVLSHLIMDTFTKEGVPWLLPIPVKIGLPPVKSLRITTGKRAETFLVFPLLLIFVIWLCASHYQQLVTIFHRAVT